jgi:hypothetical protein
MPNSAAHRGRFQVQGSDMANDLSKSWAQPTPKTAASALQDLAALELGCTADQLKHRDLAFPLARDFVHKANAAANLRAPVNRSFKNPQRPRKYANARVDLEVILGAKVFV